MAEAKKEEIKIRVMVSAFKSSCMDRAKQELQRVKAAGFDQFSVKPAKDLPGYIMVETECKSSKEAKKLIEMLKTKKITASVCG